MNDKTLQGSAGEQSRKGGGALRAALGIAVALGLLAFFLKGIDWKALGLALRSARPEFLVGCVCLTVLMYTIRAWRWHNLLLPLRDVPIARLFSITIVGFLAGFLVPRAQEGVRPYLVGRRYGIRPSAAFASIVLERLLDFLTVLVLFGAYAYLFPPRRLEDAGPLLRRLKFAGGVAALGALLGGALLYVFHARTRQTIAILDRVLSPLPFGIGGHVSSFVVSFGEGLAVLRAPASHLLGLGFQSLLLWLAIDLTVFLNNRAFGLTLPFPSSFFIVAVLLVGVSVPTPGMVGGYHVAYQQALTQVYGVDGATAAAAAITGHALSNLPVFVLGLILLRSEGLTLAELPAGPGETGSPDPPREEPDKEKERLP
jgi:uncharacterized membrane protein YbhN (UPF0104 family)